MRAVVADTHAVLWYLLDVDRLSTSAAKFLDEAAQAGEPICVATISVVEVIYLVEKGRVPEKALEVLIRALNDPHSGFLSVPLDAAVARAVRRIPREVVPDLPDRIIAATALHLDAPLVTGDRRIRAGNIRTIW
jgi:PIN domain nuclease of toxin-antitoxin system